MSDASVIHLESHSRAEVLRKVFNLNLPKYI